MIALDYRPDPSTTWQHVGDVHADDLRDHLTSWSGPSLTTGDLVRAVGDGHESLYMWSDSALHEVRDEQGPLTTSQWEGDDADAVEMLRRCTHVDRRLVVLTACDCAETALQRLPRGVPAGEDRPRRAIETARAWAQGRAARSDVHAALRDARDASADASSVAARAVYIAARDACVCACDTATAPYSVAVYTAAASADYARAAASAAATAAYATAMADAPPSITHVAAEAAAIAAARAMAPLVRRHIPLAVVARSIVEARRARAA